MAVTILVGMIVTIAVVSVWPDLGPVLTPIALVVSNITSGVVILRDSSSMEVHREKIGWRFIAAAFLLAAFTIVSIAIYAEFNDLGAFSFFDVPLLVSYLLLLMGMLAMRQAPPELGERLRIFVDGAIGAISISTLAWFAFVREIEESLLAADTWARTVGSTYPILDVALVVMAMIMLLRRSPYPFDYRLVLLGIGLVFQVAADLSFLRAGLNTDYSDVETNWILFLGAFMFYLLTAIYLGDQPRRVEMTERSVEWWPMVVPYAFSLMMVAALVYSVANSNQEGDVFWLLLATLAVAGLVFFRQAWAIKINRALVENERTALISTVSHELRTPLTAMVGFLDLLNQDEMEISKDEEEEMLAVVDQQARYLSRIVSDLVLLARGRPEMMALQRAPIRAQTILRRMLTAADPGEGRTDLRVNPDLVINADADRVQQALVNLFGNAVRYGGSHRIVAAVFNGPDMAFEVHDDGVGVPKRYERVVWDRFERGEHRLDSTKPGSGIGLSIVKAIAQAHGGWATYRQSELLGGGCFSVILPGAVVSTSRQVETGAVSTNPT